MKQIVIRIFPAIIAGIAFLASAITASAAPYSASTKAVFTTHNAPTLILAGGHYPDYHWGDDHDYRERHKRSCDYRYKKKYVCDEPEPRCFRQKECIWQWGYEYCRYVRKCISGRKYCRWVKFPVGRHRCYNSW